MSLLNAACGLTDCYNTGKPIMNEFIAVKEKPLVEVRGVCQTYDKGNAC